MSGHDGGVTPSTTGTPLAAAQFLADANNQFLHRLSLMHGWLPVVVQLIAAVVVIAAVGWRSKRWHQVGLPVSVVAGIALATVAHWYINSAGLAGDPAPHALWIWVALVGFVAAVLVTGWRRTGWWRRGTTALAVPLCVLCAALALNLWVGYFPTAQTAWNQLTEGPLPDQTDMATVTAMQQQRVIPANGTVVPIDTGDAGSGFKHRGELVYLPPAWYASNPPPKLPTLMMIGGEFNTPADWLRAGDAIHVVDRFAAAHDGNAPVLVFVDSGGAFNNDTECVNGSRGKAADHLTRDVVPAMVAKFGVSAAPANWGSVGWSMGGTCAVDLTVMHPDMFSVFEDIAGDISPNSGTKAQTIDRLFGGNVAQYASFDPTTVINRHGRYAGIAGWFAVNDAGTPSSAHSPRASDQAVAAQSLCGLGAINGIDCAVIIQPGKHDWPFAAHAFETALPWLAGQLGTPGVPRVPLPRSGPPTLQAAAR
ncbi:alpha/beta hydrolase [Mycobacterium sp. BMJ-28]